MRIDKLKQLIDEYQNLKCCGNCITWHEIEYHDYHESRCIENIKNENGAHGYCNNWKFDSLTQQDRLI